MFLFRNGWWFVGLFCQLLLDPGVTVKYNLTHTWMLWDRNVFGMGIPWLRFGWFGLIRLIFRGSISISKCEIRPMSASWDSYIHYTRPTQPRISSWHQVTFWQTELSGQRNKLSSLSHLYKVGILVINGVTTPINGLINGQLGWFPPYKWS